MEAKLVKEIDRLGDGLRLIFLQHSRSGGNALCSILYEEFFNQGIFKLGQVGSTDHSFSDFLIDAKSTKSNIYMGHFSFGIHRHITGKYEYTTILRNPVERVLSAFLVNSSKTDSDIDRWIENDFEASNGMVKRLCGFGYRDKSKAEIYDYENDTMLKSMPSIGEKEFKRACQNLDDYFPCVMINEYFAESLALLKCHYDTRTLFSLTRQLYNHNPYKSTQSNFNDKTIQRIQELNYADIQLYDLYREKFKNKINQSDPILEIEIKFHREISDLLSVRGTQILGEHEVNQRINNYIEHKIALGFLDDAIELLRRFIAKPYVSQDYYESVLNFIKLHVSKEVFEKEERIFNDRFRF